MLLNEEHPPVKTARRERKLVVKAKSLDKFTIYDACRVEKLILSDNSHMTAILHWVESRHFMGTYGVKLDDIKGYVAIGYLGKIAVGWCVLHYQTRKDNVLAVSIYVDALHRRKGYGKQIYNTLVEHLHSVDERENLKIKHYAFDKAGKKFFGNFDAVDERK